MTWLLFPTSSRPGVKCLKHIIRYRLQYKVQRLVVMHESQKWKIINIQKMFKHLSFTEWINFVLRYWLSRRCWLIFCTRSSNIYKGSGGSVAKGSVIDYWSEGRGFKHHPADTAGPLTQSHGVLGPLATTHRKISLFYAFNVMECPHNKLITPPYFSFFLSLEIIKHSILKTSSCQKP